MSVNIKLKYGEDILIDGTLFYVPLEIILFRWRRWWAVSLSYFYFNNKCCFINLL